MNLKDKILLKIHLFLNEKYSNLFFDLLKNINLILKEEEKNNRKKIFNNILSEKEKKNIYSCFHKILKSMNQKEVFLNYTFSHLEFSYLKNKAKLYYKKLYLLSIDVKKKTDLLIDYYIKLCKIEIKKFNKVQIKIDEPVIKKAINKLFSVRNRNKVLEKKVKNEKKILKKNIEEEEDFGLKIESNNNDKNKIINLFIGKFNLKKFLEKKQIIKLKKEGFVNAFIFKDTVPETIDNNNSKILKFVSPTKKIKKINIISPIKSYLIHKNSQNKNIQNKELNIKKNKNNSIINNDDSENEYNTRLLIKKKLNHKKSNSNLNYNKKFSLDNLSQLSITKKLPSRSKNLSHTSMFFSKTKNTKNSFCDTKNGDKNLPRITSSNIPINKTRNTSFYFHKRNFSTINFLSKNDLYY